MNLKIYIAVGAFFLTLPLMSATQYANGYTWTYRIKGNGAEIYGNCVGNSGAPAITPEPTGSATVLIPSTLGGVPVTRIGDYAFYFCTRLTSVTIPSSVTSIGDLAFDGCGFAYSKVRWTIRNGELTDVDLNGETDIAIPNSVKIIGPDAFRDCHWKLRSVVIPDSVTSIRANAFADCRELTSVIVGRGVTEIESSAFRALGQWMSFVRRGTGGEVRQTRVHRFRDVGNA